MTDLSSKDKNSTKGGEGFWKTLWKRHNRVPLLSGAALLVIVAVISELSGGGGLVAVISLSIRTVVTEIGFALLIAAFISAGFEESTRRQFRAEVDSRIIDIQKNVFRSTYSRNLPDHFFNEVEELLFRCNFSHSHYRIEYSFGSPHPLAGPDSQHVMDVRIRHTFSVHNLTAFASEHCIGLQIRELPYLREASCPRVMSVILRGHDTLAPEKIEEINNAAVSDRGSRNFQIQTSEVPPGDSMQVEIAAQFTTSTDGFESCHCSAPSEGLTVTAKFPS